jgi:hypothetical protein
MFENCAITHTSFGPGCVLAADDHHITIRFSDENRTEKTFLYPDAFERFLTLTDEAKQQQAMSDFAEKKTALQKEQRERAAHFHQMDLERKKERREKLKQAKKA